MSEEAEHQLLVEVAEAAGFAELTRAEHKVLRAWRNGNPAQLGDQKLPESSDDKNRLRGGLVAWLALRSNDPDAHPTNRFHVIGGYIEGRIDLAGRTTRVNLVLQRCRLCDPLVLSDAVCSSVDLNGSHIGADAYRRTSLDGRHMRVLGDVRLRDVVCDGGLALAGADIRGDLDLSGSRFGKRTANFHGYEFEVSVGAPGIRIHGALNMLRTPRDGAMFAGALNLTNARAEVLQDAPECWPGKGALFLNGFRYRQIGSLKGGATDARQRARWLLLQPDHDLGREFKPQPFEQLAKVLRETGHASDARRIGVLKQRMLRRAGKIAWHMRPFHWLFGVAVGYGYWTSRALLWLVLFVAVGAVLFDLAWRQGAMTPTRDGTLTSVAWEKCLEEAPVLTAQCWTSRAPGEDYEPFSAALYSLDVFLPVIDLEQESAWSPAPRRGEPVLDIAVGRWAWGYRFVHELLGYLLMGFAAAGLTKLAERG